MRNLGHGSHGPKSLATDRTDRRSLPRIARTEELLPRITPITRTAHLFLTPAADRSPARGLPRDPWPEVSCHGSRGPKSCCHGSHRSHTDRTSLSQTRGRSIPGPWPSVRSVARSLLPRIARTKDLCHGSHRSHGPNISLSNPRPIDPRSVAFRAIRGPKSVATHHTDQRTLPRIA